MKNSINERESGQAIVLLAIAFTVLLGFVALAIDGGRVYMERSKAQNAADAAAMSAALAKCRKQNIEQAALNMAISNGYDNNGTTNTVQVENPPASGEYSGDSDYIEVTITSTLDSGFAHFIFKGPLRNTVHATSICKKSTPGSITNGYALIALNPLKSQSVTVTGSGGINVDGGGVLVNSSASAALSLSGSANVTADVIDIVGNWKATGSGTATSPSLNTGVTPISDPLADLLPPPRPSGTCTKIGISKPLTINPGLYCEIKVSAGGVLTMTPGIYWIESGDFSASGSGIITAHDVMIYFGPSAGKLTLTGGGSLDITGLTSGTYQGMMAYVDRDNHNPVAITGNGDLTSLSGTTYAASSKITVTGNGSNTTLNAQIIGDTVVVTGDGGINVNYDASKEHLSNNPTSVVALIK